MAIQNSKITEDELRSHRVQSAPDDLTGMATNEVKAVFDKLPTLQSERYNSLIDSLMANTAAAEIGTTSGESVQEEFTKRIISGDIAYLKVNEDNCLERSLDGIHYTKVGSEGHIITNEESTLFTNRRKLRFEGGVTVEDSPLTDETIVTAYYSDEQIKKVQTYTATHTKSGTVHTLTGLPSLDGLFAVQFKAAASALTTDTWAGASAVNEISGDFGISFAEGDCISCLCQNSGGEKVLVFGAGATGARELFAQMLTQNITAYISPTGNDTTGDGSQLNPWASLNKAMGSIPKNLNGYIATISMVQGDYYMSSALGMGFFYGGRIIINGNNSNIYGITTTHTSLTFGRVGCETYVNDLNFINRYTGAPNVSRALVTTGTGSLLSLRNCSFDGGGVGYSFMSFGITNLHTCSFTNSARAIYAGGDGLTVAKLYQVTIDNTNDIGVSTLSGLIILGYAVTNNAVTKEVKTYGGQIWS